MARFAYTARDRSGKTVAADVDAPNRKDVLRLLSARGLQVVAVTERGGGPGAPAKTKKNAIRPDIRRFRCNDLVTFHTEPRGDEHD